MSRYLAAPPEPPRVDRHRIAGGLAGTRATAAHVARLIREGAGDFYVRQRAIDILIANGVPAKDYLGEIDALFRWVQRHVRYTKDPFRIEVLHSARRMLELKAGDCDDMTIVLGALVKSIGHPVRIVITGPDGRRPDVFSHIYLEARHHDHWIPLDATMPYGMGWSPRTPVRQVLSIEEDHADARSRTDTRSTAATAAALAGTGRAAGARARLAARRDRRHPSRWTSTEGSAREGAVERDAAAPGTGAASVGAHAATLHLAEGPRRAAPAEDGGTAAGGAQGSRRLSPSVSRLASPDRSRPPHDDAARRAAPAATARGAARRDGQKHGAASSSADGTRAGAHAGEHAAPPALRDDVRSAATLYRRFTQSSAAKIQQVTHTRLMPPVVVDLGQLAGLVYRSSKWVGRPRTYIHFMDDPPRLVSDITGRRLFIVGGSYRVTRRGIEG